MLIFATTISAVALGRWILFTLTILKPNFLDFQVPVELICVLILYLFGKVIFFKKETIPMKLLEMNHSTVG